MKIQIKKEISSLLTSPQELKQLQKEFKNKQCIFIPRFIESKFLKLIQKEIETSKFTRRIHKNIGEELVLKNKNIIGLLHFLLNDQELFNTVQEVSNCPKIANIRGRVYRFTSNHGDFDSWHNDLVDKRLIALSINLSSESYSGGILQIRDRYSKQILHEVANTGFGDAIIFNLAPHLQHRVTSVTGTAAKTAFAGWFRSKPSYESYFKKKLLQKSTKRLHRFNIQSNATPVLNEKVKINKFIISRKRDENTVLINTNTGLYLGLNPIGSKIWEMIGEKRDLKEIFYILKREYDVTPAILERDLLQQVQELKSANILIN